MKGLSRKVGEKIFRWTILSVTDEIDPVSKCRYYECQCDCGTIRKIKSKNLDGTRSKSCGCYRVDWSKDNGGYKELDTGVAAFNTLVRHYKASAAKRKLSFNLTDSQIQEITKRDCIYCGCKPIREQKNTSKHDNTGVYLCNGIDRVDSAKGYEIDNVVAACTTCNLAKSNMSLDEFGEWIKILTKNFDISLVKTKEK